MGDRPFKALYNSKTHFVAMQWKLKVCVSFQECPHMEYCIYCKQILDPSLAVCLRNSSSVYFDLPILMGSTEDRKLWRAAIFMLVVSIKMSHFNTLNCRLVFLYTFETCSFKVTFLSILIPNNMTDSSFSNVVLYSMKVGSGSSLVLLQSYIIS